jgi:hypothetical protein
MRSGRRIVVVTLFGLGLAIVPAARANPASDACAALANARIALYSMLNAKDKSTLDALKAKVQATSTTLDSVLAGMTGADAQRRQSSRRFGISSRRRARNRSSRRSTRAISTMPKRLPMAFSLSVYPRCGKSCRVSKMKEEDAL